MNFKKTLAGAAAVVLAATSVSAVASAEWTVIDTLDANGLQLGWAASNARGVVLYYDGSRPNNDASKAIVDYGIDISKMASVEAYISITDDTRADWEDNAASNGWVGGSLTVSSNVDDTNGPKNWTQHAFGNFNDPDLGIEADTSQPVVLEKVGDYVYKGSYTLDADSKPEDNSVIVQLALEDWSGVTFWAADVNFVVRDADGNVMISFNKDGSPVIGAMPTDLKLGSGSAAETTTSSDTQAATAGDTTAATDSSKGSPDTGIEDVAAVAGLALVAGGAIVLAKKRK